MEKNKFWIDGETDHDNVIILSNNAIFVASCDSENATKTHQQLDSGTNPIELFGTKGMTIIPLNQIQSLVSRSTDRDVEVRYKTKKEIEDKTLDFDEIEKMQDFMNSIDGVMPTTLVKKENQQSIFKAALSPLVSLLIGIALIYIYIDKLRWLAIIVGGLWALGSAYMLATRISQPPMVTRWTIKGKHLRKTWSGVKTAFSYLVLAAIVIAFSSRFPDSYGEKAINDHLEFGELTSTNIQELVDQGADLNFKDENGDAPIFLAMDWADDEVVIALMDAGADLSIENSYGQTPLQYAIYHQYNADLVEAILKKGGSLDFQFEDGQTPLEYAREMEDEELEKLLKQYSK